MCNPSGPQQQPKVTPASFPMNAGDNGISANPDYNPSAPLPAPPTSKFGNLMSFLKAPLAAAGVGAASAMEPTRAIGGGGFGPSFVRAFGGAEQYGATQRQAQQQQEYERALESRIQEQGEEQHALAAKYMAQANKPQAPQLYQFGDQQYIWDPDKASFSRALDANGNPIDGGKKEARIPAPKLITAGPLAGYQESTDQQGNVNIAPGTVHMPLPTPDTSGPVGGLFAGEDTSSQPALSLPSIMQDNAQARDTKGRWTKTEWTRSAPNAPKQLVMIDENPDSPTFGTSRPVKGVTEADAPDKVANRLQAAQDQQSQVEALADAAVSGRNGNYDQALAAVDGSKVIPPELKAGVRNRIREIAKPAVKPVKTNPLQDLINNATQGLNVPAVAAPNP